MKSKIVLTLFGVLAVALLYSFIPHNTFSTKKQFALPAPAAIKLYVLDGGVIEKVDATKFGLKKEDVPTDRFAVPVFLVVHPKGTLIWDTGMVPDDAWKYSGSPILYRLMLPDRTRELTLNKPIKTQLTEIGYTPAAITYLALSHYHYDHTGNANMFANSTWLVRKNEYDAMFAQPPPDVTVPFTYASLKDSKKKFIDTDEYDVFGDGSVIIKSAPGHTPGHQVLFLKLKKTGNIVLSGDLYHYIEERTFDKYPSFEYSVDQTRATRILIDSFVKKNKAQLWIQHDMAATAKLKKSPAYYE